MSERYECPACGKLTAANRGNCDACGSGLVRLPRYFSKFSPEVGDALDAALRHIHAPIPNSASALLRLMVFVDEWLEADERLRAHHIVRHGKLIPVLEENGEHTIASLVRSGHLDESTLTPRQLRALRHAEVQVTAITDLEAALDRRDDAAALEAWWSAIRDGVPLDTQLLRRVGEVRWRLMAIPPQPSETHVHEREAPLRPQLAQQRLRAARDRTHSARSTRLRAAGISIAHEDGTEDLDWTLVAEFERRARDLTALHDAIARGDVAAAARAWLLVRSVWPESVTDDLEKAGTNALRSWGGSLRAASGEECTGDR